MCPLLHNVYCTVHTTIVDLAWLLQIKYLFSIIMSYRLFPKALQACRDDPVLHIQIQHFTSASTTPCPPPPPSLPPEYTALMSPNIGRNGSSSRLQFSCPCFYFLATSLSSIPAPFYHCKYKRCNVHSHLYQPHFTTASINGVMFTPILTVTFTPILSVKFTPVLKWRL